MSGILFFIFASCEPLRRNCTSVPLAKNSIFCDLSLNYQHLFEKMIYASYSLLSKKLKKGIKIQVGQAVLELIKTLF